MTDASRNVISNSHADSVHAMWCEILDACYHEIIELHANREVWRFFNEHLGAAEHGGVALETLARWYVDAQAACVRRQYTHADKRSLGRLLASVKANAEVMTRTRFRSLWPQLLEADGDAHGFFSKDADRHFDAWACDGGDTIDSAIVESDIALLEAAAKKVSRWADENVAHSGRTKSVAMTFGELDAAIATLGALLQRYHLLLTAKSLASPTPHLPLSWQQPFRRPLIE